jgi:hypothetical protein
LFIFSFQIKNGFARTINKSFYRSAENSFNDQSSLFSLVIAISDNSFADDFASNRNVYFHAMTQYYNDGFTYFELGDGDELWKTSFKTILGTQVYLLLKNFMILKILLEQP